MSVELVSFLLRIKDAKRCEDVFGTLDPSAQYSEAKMLYRRFASLVHEDKHQNSPEDLAIAKEAFQLLSKFWIEAQERITAGTYGTKVVTVKTSAVIASQKHKYTIGEVIAGGDLTSVYGGENEAGVKVIVKVSRTPAVNDLVTNEASVAADLLERSLPIYQAFFPHLIESFRVRDKVVRQVNVFEDNRNGKVYPLTEIVANYPQGIDPRHFVWIFKRLLSMLDYTHRCGWVHGAILPTHVLVRPSDHGVLLVDWSYARKFDQCIPAISPGYRGFYAPEVLAKRPAGPFTDLYMAAKCMEYILGGETAAGIPGPFLRLLDACLVPNPARRLSSAFGLFEEVIVSARTVYGAPRFVDLVLS